MFEPIFTMKLIYEIRDTSNEEGYEVHGFFEDLQEAVDQTMRLHGSSPLSNDPEEYVKLAVVEHELGKLAPYGVVRHECEWIEEYSETDDDTKWRGPTVLPQPKAGLVRHM